MYMCDLVLAHARHHNFIVFFSSEEANQGPHKYGWGIRVILVCNVPIHMYYLCPFASVPATHQLHRFCFITRQWRK